MLATYGDLCIGHLYLRAGILNPVVDHAFEIITSAIKNKVQLLLLY